MYMALTDSNIENINNFGLNIRFIYFRARCSPRVPYRNPDMPRLIDMVHKIEAFVSLI
jgi:hypothetical protein